MTSPVDSFVPAIRALAAVHGIELTEEELETRRERRSVCFHCHDKSENEAYKCCSRCRGAYFCSQSCMTLGWPEHKVHCVKVETKALELQQRFLARQSQTTGGTALATPLSVEAAKVALKLCSYDEDAAFILIAFVQTGAYVSLEMTSRQMLEVVLQAFGLEGKKHLPDDLSEFEVALGTRERTEDRMVAQEAEMAKKASEMASLMKKIEKNVLKKLYLVLPQVLLMRRYDVFPTNKELVDLYVCRATKARTYQELVKEGSLPNLLLLLDECCMGLNVTPLPGCPYKKKYLTAAQAEIKAALDKSWLEFGMIFDPCDMSDAEMLKYLRSRFCIAYTEKSFGEPDSFIINYSKSLTV